MQRAFNIHSLPFLFTALLFLIFPLFVTLKNRRSLVARGFFFWGFSAFIWQLPYFIGYNLTNQALIHSLYKIAYIGLIFISPSVYYFFTRFLNFKSKRPIYIFYSIALILVVVLFKTNYIIDGITPFEHGTRTNPGQFHSLFLIYVLAPLFLSLKLLYREYKRTKSPYNKKRIKFFLISLPIAYLSVVDILAMYGLKVYPFGFIFLVFFGVSTTYAITRYRLLDIEVIIKKASLIIAGFIIAFSLIYVYVLYLQPFFYSLPSENWLIFPMVLSLIIGSGLYSFINFVRHIQESELTKKFSYRSILRKEAVRVSTAKNIKELLAYLVRDLSSLVRLDYVAIFVSNDKDKNFSLARDFSRGKKSQKLPLNFILTSKDIIVEEILKTKKPLISSELEFLINTNSLLAEEKKLKESQLRHMRRINAEILIPSFCQDQLLAIFAIGSKVNSNEIITSEDLEIFTSLSSTIARAIHSFILAKEKIRLIVASQNTIISAIEAKDSYTRGHTERVAKYTSLIGAKLEVFLRNFPHGLASLDWSAQLHDVGKIGIPDSILLKPATLTKEEMQVIKEHTLNAFKIINPVSEWLGKDIISGIMQHHENFDGSGYPYGLKGDEIHIFARIIRVADAFDAMTSTRPYRMPVSVDAAIEELIKYRGIHFDPDIVDILRNNSLICIG